MKTPGIALTAALGFFIFWGGAISHAQPGEPPKWEKIRDPALAIAFEKLTGQTAWEVKFGKTEETASAVVLSNPKSAGPRVAEGTAAELEKKIADRPSDWRPLKTSDENSASSRYVFIEPPPQLKTPGVLTGRVYSLPILLSPGITTSDAVLLIDATYQALIDSRERKKSADLTGMFAKDGQPYFTHVFAIDTKDRVGVMPRDIASHFRYVGISHPHGETWIVFDIKDGKAALVNVGFAEF